jgi:hypothetical protein
MNAQLPTVAAEAGEIMEQVMIKGDLARLTPAERSNYYATICRSMGLNPLSKPFEFITLNGKLTLYARKDCTDQLRKRHGVSVMEMTEVAHEGLTVVTVKVCDASGRTDMAKGAVSLKGLQGEALANAIMKAETKAKRRATLSICGLGFLDETEIEDIPEAKRPQPRGVPKHTVRDRTEVVWDENEERAPTLADIDHEANEARAEEYGDVQAERLGNAVRGEPWHTLGPVKQAAIRCGEPAFWKFIEEFSQTAIDSADAAARWVRVACGVNSRAALATDAKAAAIWADTDASYIAWKLDPSPAVLPATSPAPSNSPHSPEGAGNGDESARHIEIDRRLTEAASKGTAALLAEWKKLPRADQAIHEVAKNKRHKLAAAEADKAHAT